MKLQMRRVVTGHSDDGRAIVQIDEPVKNVVASRPGVSSCVVWSSKGFPVDNDEDSDPTTGSFKTTVDNGTVFRVVRYEPGVVPRNHRTDSIDYAVVISGEMANIPAMLRRTSASCRAGRVSRRARSANAIACSLLPVMWSAIAVVPTISPRCG